jgi:hypothetical protein
MGGGIWNKKEKEIIVVETLLYLNKRYLNMSIDIKNQFARVFNRKEPDVGALGKRQEGDYYSGIKVWGGKIKGGNRD